jgi:hypothetical protein
MRGAMVWCHAWGATPGLPLHLLALWNALLVACVACGVCGAMQGRPGWVVGKNVYLTSKADKPTSNYLDPRSVAQW